MKVCLKVWILSTLIVLSGKVAQAQKKNPTWIGKAKGVVRDSVHNHVLSSATLAVYKITDSSLISYQLSNNFGEFQFNDLPFEMPLKIVATYVGYSKYEHKFTISRKTVNEVDLGNISLQISSALEEVNVIATAPMRMHGDTLEFNADAFNLDNNAVGEDLLRKLPGVVVWGDGTITVNGREISSLLVNGKPFFGKNSKMATQNIPKDAIDKVQVYRKDVNPLNPLDSTSEINFKLKKYKGFNHFGKIGAGYGTNHRYEADGTLNFFSPMTQFGVATAANNINKFADNITTLINNSNYKGVGVNIDYQPDFTVKGLNRPTIGGLTFQHDFTLEPEKFKINRFTANYFAVNTNSTINSNTNTLLSSGDNIYQSLNSISNNKLSTFSQNLDAAYNRHIGKYSFLFEILYNANNITKNTIQKNSSKSSILGIQSSNSINNLSNNDFKNINLTASIAHQKSAGGNERTPGNWTLSYSMQTSSNKSDTSKIADLISFINPLSTAYYDRKYNRTEANFNQHLNTKLNDFSNLFFDYRGSIAIGLENDIKLNYSNYRNNVSDRDTIINNYLPNLQLSINRNYTIINEQPGLNISKKISKRLSGRFQKDIIFSATMQAQLFHQQSNSENSYQSFKRTYKKLIPKASFMFDNTQYNYFSNQLSLSFSSSYVYPTLEQLFPIVDYSNFYNIQTGNSLLKPSKKDELSFLFQHKGLRPKNTIDYSLSAAAGTIKDGFAYNSYTDSSGRLSYSYVNLNGFRYAAFLGKLKKAYKFRNNQVQFQFSGSLNFSKNPSYIRSFADQSPVINNSQNIVRNASLNAYYTYKNYFAISLSQDINTYTSNQSKLDNTDFESTLKSTQLSASINFTPRLAITSNLTRNNNTFTGSKVVHFTIWNANAAYRFRKENDIELKISALDLLHQNTGIINYGNSFMLTNGSVNVLQHYFIATLSYFPRKFSKKTD